MFRFLWAWFLPGAFIKNSIVLSIIVVYYRCSQWENTFYSIYLRWCKTRFVFLGGKSYNTQNEVKHVTCGYMCLKYYRIQKTIANVLFSRTWEILTFHAAEIGQEHPAFCKKQQCRKRWVREFIIPFFLFFFFVFFFFLVTHYKHRFFFY